MNESRDHEIFEADTADVSNTVSSSEQESPSLSEGEIHANETVLSEAERIKEKYLEATGQPSDVEGLFLDFLSKGDDEDRRLYKSPADFDVSKLRNWIDDGIEIVIGDFKNTVNQITERLSQSEGSDHYTVAALRDVRDLMNRKLEVIQAERDELEAIVAQKQAARYAA